MRKTNLARLLALRPDGIFIASFEQGETGPDLFRKACEFGLEGLVSKRRDSSIGRAARQTGSSSRTGDRARQGGVFVNVEPAIIPQLFV
jgi:hypothetical protein